MKLYPIVLTIGVLVAVGFGNVLQADAGLINYWSFDETAGSTVAVDSAGGLDATLQGDAQFVTDTARGQVLELDGSGDYANNSGEPFTDKTTHTVAVWVKHDSFGGQRYISWGPRYFFGIYPEGQIEGNGCISFAAGGSDKCFFADAFYGGTDPLVDTSWHYWTAIFDSESNLATLYCDGQFVQQKSLTGGTTNTTAGLRIGAQYNGGECLDGRLDDLAIWDEILTAGQIQNAMTLGAENYAVPEPSTLGLCFAVAIMFLTLFRCHAR